MGGATDKANRLLRDLWIAERKRADDKLLDLYPLQYPELQTRQLVFVGMNPSHAEENEPILRVTRAEDLQDEERVKKIIDLELRALGRKDVDPVAYYRPLQEFHPSWEHLDIFAVRDASQRRALTLLQPDGVLTSFAEAQLQVFDELLVALQPSTVVVINAGASAILRKRYAACTFDDERGHHVVVLGARHTPIFFSGMLTGQRSLDVHSRERLVWHVKRTVENLGT